MLVGFVWMGLAAGGSGALFILLALVALLEPTFCAWPCPRLLLAL